MMCVTHEMGFARRIARRVIFIDGGTIAEDRPTADFFGDTASPRAKSFLGRILQP